MTYSAWNMIWRTAGAGRMGKLSNRLTSAVHLFLALVLIGLPAETQAADEQSGPFLFVSSTRTSKDIEIEAKARRALRQDAQLRPLNLGVHISGGMAKLSGPVPRAELKQRAIAIVQHVNGVLNVSAKDLYVSTSDQLNQGSIVLLQDDQPTQSHSASPGSQTRGLGSLGPQLPAGTGRPITLLAPEMASPAPPALPSAALEGGKVGAGRLTANPHPLSPARSISKAIEQMRLRETRYQQIRVRVQGGTVYCFPNGSASEDAMTFAQAIRRLPGVQHVIMASDRR